MNEGDGRITTGWHNDRDDPLITRYWDGTRWTDERRWNGTEWVTSSAQPAPPASPWVPPTQSAVPSPDVAPAADAPKKGFSGKKVVAIVAAVVAVLVLIGVVFGDDDSDGDKASSGAVSGGSGDEDAFATLVLQQLSNSGFPYDASCVRAYIHDDWSYVESQIALSPNLSEADAQALVAAVYFLGVPTDC